MEFLAMLYTVLLVAICLMMALLLFRSGRPTGGLDEADCEELKDWLEEQLAAQAREFNARQDAIAQQNYAAIRSVSETLQTAVQSMSTTLGQGQDSQQRILERRLQSLEQANNQQMEQLRRAMVESMTALQAENTRKLDEIRHTVDEQLQDALQKRVTESFKAVNQQLEQVYKGLGEMQSLAADVGGLKQVLSGVKTRGILGEIQLGAILEEILAPEQYDTNVATIPGSTQRVEYAIRMPGADGGSVWLPIDSKFPGDTYAHLQDAYASGDAQAVEDARHALELVLRSEARDIREKYVEPPYTTAFGILFLPFEGLYAEVVNAGLLEVLQRGLSGQRGRPQHHGGPAEQPANGLQDPRHPETLRRGLAAAGCGEDGVRQVRAGPRQDAAASAPDRRRAGPAHRRPQPGHQPEAAQRPEPRRGQCQRPARDRRHERAAESTL